jgi:ribosomal subunit interface protein
MQITITGKQINIGEALRNHAQGHLSDTVSKYFDKPIEAHVVFSKPGKGKAVRADISVHVGRGIKFQGHGETDEPYSAYEMAAEKVGKQLRRQKRRLRDHRRTALEDPAGD